MWRLTFRKPRTIASPRPPYRLRLEALEDRCVPSAGGLDSTFGSGGTVTTNIASRNNDHVSKVLIQSDGRIVAAGWTGSPASFALARYTAGGALDSSFNKNGKVTTGFGGNTSSLARAAALQGDGKIVVAGSSSSGGFSGSFALARYNPNGSLDGGFNGSGKVTAAFAPNHDDAAFSMDMQADGKMIVAGFAAPSGNPTAGAFGLMRFNANGTLDPSFGSGGKVTTDVGPGRDIVYDVAVQPDGKIVVAGYTEDAPNGHRSFALARYNSTGSLDATFGTTGLVITALTPPRDYSIAYSITLQTDGKLLAAGKSELGFTLVRYNPDGTTDSTFGTAGVATTPATLTPSDEAFDVALQPDGKIVAAVSDTAEGKFVVARYVPAGNLDPTFNGTGIATTQLGSATSLAIQPTDGKIVVGGSAYTGSNNDFALARYLGDPAAPAARAVATGAAGDEHAVTQAPLDLVAMTLLAELSPKGRSDTWLRAFVIADLYAAGFVNFLYPVPGQ